jgi:outer membrane lipoprotein-sorting protein
MTAERRRHPPQSSADVRRGHAGILRASTMVLVGLLLPAAIAEALPLRAPVAMSRPSVLAVAGRPATVPPAPAPQQQTPPDPVIPDPRNRGPANIFTSFDAAQRAQAAKVSAYLSSLQNLSGNFVQVGPDGGRSTGSFVIQKPGKVRFEYDPPNPVAIIADGNAVAVRDNKLETQDLYPLSQTPLRFLLSDRIDLMRDTNVVAVSADDLYVTVTIEEKQPLIGTSRMMLMMGAKDNQLKQWTITDPQGYDTTIAVYNLDSNRKFDPAIFKIDSPSGQYRN